MFTLSSQGKNQGILAHSAGGTFLKLKLLGKDFFMCSFRFSYTICVPIRHIGGGGGGCSVEAVVVDMCIHRKLNVHYSSTLMHRIEAVSLLLL